MTSLSERINNVMKEVKALEADKKHQQGYGYISADKILARVGEAMANHGISIVPACLEHTTHLHTYTDSYGKEKMLWQVDAQMEMSVSDTDGGEKTVKWTGSGVDYATPDKALYKAMTSGHKYFVMKLFMVGVGNEDGEHEAHEEISGRNVTTNPPNAPKPAQTDNGIQTLNDYENKVYTNSTPAVFFKAAADWIGCTQDEAKEKLRQLGHDKLDKEPLGRVTQLRQLHNAILLPENDVDQVDHLPHFDRDATAV